MEQLEATGIYLTRTFPFLQVMVGVGFPLTAHLIVTWLPSSAAYSVCASSSAVGGSAPVKYGCSVYAGKAVETNSGGGGVTAGKTQAVPQPVEQHFRSSEQSASDLHS